MSRLLEHLLHIVLVCLTLASVCPLSGCGDPSLYLTVSEWPQGATRLRVRINLNGQLSAADQYVSLGQNQFIVRLPSGASGDVWLEITAVDDQSCGLAMTSLHATIPGGLGRYDKYDVTLVPLSANGWAWCNPTPLGIQPSAIWGSGSTDVWVAGTEGALLHYDGAFWAPVRSGTTEDIIAIWGSAPADVWALASTTMLHWDGANWNISPSGIGAGVQAISIAGPNDVWMLQDILGTSTILQWQGSQWIPIPTQPGINSSSKLWGSGPPRNEIWVVGAHQEGTTSKSDILRWNGTQWNQVLPEQYRTTFFPTNIWGNAAGEVWASGGGGTLFLDRSGTWTPIPRGAPTDFYGFWSSGQNLGWAINSSQALLWWDGKQWVQSSSTLPPNSAVWGTGPNDVWAVNVSDNGFGELGTISHWDGHAWSSISSGKMNTMLKGIWGSPNDIWTVGAGGQGNNVATILHWHDRKLDTVTSSQSDNYFGVWGSGSPVNNLWVVGSQGSNEVLLNYYNNSQWSHYSKNLMVFLNGVWGSSPNSIWAVGSSNTILHFDGKTGQLSAAMLPPIPTGTTWYFSGVWGSTANDIWAVGYSVSSLGGGQKGLILHYDGMVWTDVSPPIAPRFQGVWGSGSGDVWAAGFGGIWHWDGTAWSAKGPSASFNTVWGSGQNDVWVTEYRGSTLWHWDGANWNKEPTGTPSHLQGLWGSGPNDVWVVGSSGTILHRSR